MSHTLVRVAALVRARLDSGSGDELSEQRCGELADDMLKFVKESGTGEYLPKGNPLTLREACNKIIHAHTVRGFCAQDDYGVRAPIFRLFGIYKGKQWDARIDCFAFANAVLAVCAE